MIRASITMRGFTKAADDLANEYELPFSHCGDALKPYRMRENTRNSKSYIFNDIRDDYKKTLGR